MAHGIPLDPGTDEHELGVDGAHMLDVGLSSTGHIAAFFGIAPLPEARSRRAVAADGSFGEAAPVPSPKADPSSFVQDTIENALKKAGLMK
jgi:hypothetical protein